LEKKRRVEKQDMDQAQILYVRGGRTETLTVSRKVGKKSEHRGEHAEKDKKA